MVKYFSDLMDNSPSMIVDAERTLASGRMALEESYRGDDIKGRTQKR